MSYGHNNVRNQIVASLSPRNYHVHIIVGTLSTLPVVVLPLLWNTDTPVFWPGNTRDICRDIFLIPDWNSAMWFEHRTIVIVCDPVDPDFSVVVSCPPPPPFNHPSKIPSRVETLSRLMTQPQRSGLSPIESDVKFRKKKSDPNCLWSKGLGGKAIRNRSGWPWRAIFIPQRRHFAMSAISISSSRFHRLLQIFFFFLFYFCMIPRETT